MGNRLENRTWKTAPSFMIKMLGNVQMQPFATSQRFHVLNPKIKILINNYFPGRNGLDVEFKDLIAAFQG